jgi:cysteine desulfurase
VLDLPVYLDNHATTRPDPRVVAAMLPYFSAIYGNAASQSHRFGWDAADAVDRARAQVAALIGADPREIVFTSGATEANNLAIKGAAWASKRTSGHLVTAATEHRAVLDPMNRLTRDGWSLTVLPVDRHGRVDPQDVAHSLTDRTVLVSLMAANNEVGTLHPIAEIGRLCRERGVLFHTDATQAAGKVPLDVERDAIDLLSLSAHKFYGPKGIGALYVRRQGPRVRLVPLLDGGGHERGFRSGTLAVPLIAGLGVAAELAARERDDEARQVSALRDRLETLLNERLPGVQRNGHPVETLPGNLNLSFEGVDGEALLMNVRDVAVSSGSACSSAQPEPSHVLRAMGVPEHLARASLRFGLGKFNTPEEIDFAATYVAEVILRLRTADRSCPP